MRLFPEGHTGYGKAGSYEGYCSGGGIAQYGLGSAREPVSYTHLDVYKRQDIMSRVSITR